MKRIGMIALLFGVLVAGSALAYGFHSEEERTAIQEAVENKDYDAYIEAVGTQITEEEFLKMAEDRMMPGIGMRMRGTGISRCTLP